MFASRLLLPGTLGEAVEGNNGDEGNAGDGTVDLDGPASSGYTILGVLGVRTDERAPSPSVAPGLLSIYVGSG